MHDHVWPSLMMMMMIVFKGYSKESTEIVTLLGEVFYFMGKTENIQRHLEESWNTYDMAGTRETRQRWPAGERTVEKSVLNGGGRVAGWREARLLERGLWCTAKRICQWKTTWPFCQGQGKWLLLAHRTYFISAFGVLAFISFYSPAWTHFWIYALLEA